ncbi:MAG: VanZ family protein [Planctomycetota bacterium]|jgi:VanZ family protein
MSEPRRRAWCVAAGWTAVAAASAALYCASDRPLQLHGGYVVHDKLLHFGAYAVVACLWYAALRATWPAGRAVPHAWTAAACAALYGATDEWHQSFVPGRVADGWDWLADAAGALAVALAVTAWATLRRRPPAA